MKKTKRILSLLICIILVIGLFVGCGKSQVSSQNNMIEVQDQLGRKVKIKSNPQKIVSSYYIATSILLALDGKDKLVGIEGKSKKRELYKKVDEKLLKLPAVGSGKEINVEECTKLKPDVVIIPTRLKKFIPQFEKLSIPVLAVQPETPESYKECVNLFGKILGKEDKSKELLKYQEDILNDIKKKNEKNKNKTRIYLSGTSNILRTCTSKMYQNYMIDAVGGDNVTKDLKDGYWANISVEQLIKYNPEVIYIVSYAKYKIDDVLKDTRLKGIDAVKNKKVYMFPGKFEAWDFPIPSSILGILWMENNLYGDRLSKEDLNQKVKEFYKKFYNIDVNAKELGI